jgi:hypothetical protein
VGAALLDRESLLAGAPVATCVQSPTPLPYFGHQHAEMLAMLVVPVEQEGEVLQP